MLVAAHKQSVDACVSRRLDNLLGLGGRLSDAEPCTETLERSVTGFYLLLFEKRIGAPVQVFRGKSVGVFQQAIGVEFLPARDLSEMTLDLGRGGKDDRDGVALDERLDRGRDAMQKFEQFLLADLIRVVTEGLRLGEPAVTRHGTGIVVLLVFRHTFDPGDALRKAKPGCFREIPARALVEARVRGADRQQPERSGILKDRQERFDVEVAAQHHLLRDWDRQLEDAVETGRQKNCQPLLLVLLAPPKRSILDKSLCRGQ